LYGPPSRPVTSTLPAPTVDRSSKAFRTSVAEASKASGPVVAELKVSVNVPPLAWLGKLTRCVSLVPSPDPASTSVWTVIVAPATLSPEPLVAMFGTSVLALAPWNMTVYGPPGLPETLTLPAPIEDNASSAVCTSLAGASNASGGSVV